MRTRLFHGIWFAACICAVLWHGCATAGPGIQNSTIALPPTQNEMRWQVAEASRSSPPWTGPVSGPAGRRGMSIAIICEDLRNGGILGVAQGIDEAAKVIGWTVKIFDANGTPTGRAEAVADALAWRPNGLIVVGADAKTMQAQLEQFSSRGVPIVGWHVGPKAGVMAGSPVAMNVSTDPMEVARITAMEAVVASGGKGGVVIFTDSNFGIAMVKANAMADIVKACKKCRLLSIRDVAISKSAESVPTVTRHLLARYGKHWTVALAINDIYFDYAVPEFTKAGLSESGIVLLSAGDGSPSAFMRIQAGTFQIGTVAEPLNLHGWQLVDELNRLLAGQPVSGYVVPVHLVTASNVASDNGMRFQYDPDNGYRDIYRRIWKR